ncbi:GNAT family N-acetyltransferase [Novosphingobium sp. B 225]|uniref:GNAT family N-acetyltransferase n=1 Tax=Novosphingobium sp. B 225 TaxID=1961849 RepID=UPI000B4B0A99|nr:GNAT family N-acetyltransferase [Novosphingobium sp. B 225]
MISVTYHDDLKEVQADAPLAALLSAPSARSPFDRLEWWQGLTTICDLFPLIAVIHHGNERGVMPLLRKARQVHCLTNWYNFRVSPLFSAGADQAAMLAELASDLPGQTPHLVLSPLPDENGETTALAKALRQAGWVTFVEQCDVNHILPVQGRTYAEYLAGRPGQVRTTLKRKASKVEIRIETAFNPDSWAAYETIYAQSWKGEEGSPAFLRRFAEQEGKAGRLRLGLALADGEPVAAQFWTVEHGTAFIHKLAHTEASKPLSPGTTLTAALFEQVIDRDHVDLVDFGTGNDPYKRDWMEQLRPRYRIEAFRPRWPGTWPAIARKALRRLVPSRAHG